VAVVALYDANVLYPNTLRDMLIRIAQTGLVQARWSQEILDECLGALRRNRPDISGLRLDGLRYLMITAVRDCLVEGYEPLIPTLTLPDLEDRHVLAAAIGVGGQVLVTANLADFPDEVLRQWRIAAMSPDDFLLEQVITDAAAVWHCVDRIATSRRRPPESPEDVPTQLERCGAGKAAAALRGNRRTARR